MEEKQKLELLKKLDTLKLTEELKTAVGIFGAELQTDLEYRLKHRDFIATGNSDSPAVAQLEMELLANAEGKNESQRKAWLGTQRQSNEPLQKAIAMQLECTFQAELHRNNVEVAKKKMEALKAIIALKTAQISFLT